MSSKMVFACIDTIAALLPRQVRDGYKLQECQQNVGSNYNQIEVCRQTVVSNNNQLEACTQKVVSTFNQLEVCPQKVVSSYGQLVSCPQKVYALSNSVATKTYTKTECI